MKIRNKRLVKLAGRIGSFTARSLVRSLRIEHRPIRGGHPPAHLPADNTDRHIYAIWHENLLLPAVHFGHPSLAVLISKHADGQILGSLITAMGMGQVLGSTNRDGVKAVRELIRPDFPYRHLAVTPDGPRGPRRIVQPGIIFVAAVTGMSIVCVGVGYHRPWRAGSWDRFAIPKPCSRAKCLTADPIRVPKLRPDELETYRLRVQAEMDRVQLLTEQWADTNRLGDLDGDIIELKKAG